MSEVHLMNRAAVSPSFNIRQAETTQELGALLGTLVPSPFGCVLCFPVPVCCVWSEKKESDVCTWELRVKNLSLTQQCFSVV